MKFLTIFSLALLLSTCKQKNIQRATFQKGTLLIAAIASDGIVLAADSRMTNTVFWQDRKTIHSVWFRDSCQKIFLIQGAPLSAAGNYTKDSFNIYREIDTFQRLWKFDRTRVPYFWPAKSASYSIMFKYMEHKYPGNSIIITGGYVKDTAFIHRLQIDRIDLRELTISGKTPVFSDWSAFPIYMKYAKDTNILRTSEELRVIMDSTISEFGSTLKTVGGPVSVLKIHKDNSTEFLQNDFSKKPFGQSAPQLVPVQDTGIWYPQMRAFYSQ